jgi:hypothetical protein
MDFYTVKTSVDIVSDKAAFECLVARIGFFTQPIIMGDPFEEDGEFLFRFAVYKEALRHHETMLIALLDESGFAFTTSNTEVIRATRI